MGFPQAGGGTGTVKSVQGVAPDGGGNVDLSTVFYQAKNGGPEPFASQTMTVVNSVFTPDLTVANRWEVKIQNTGIHVAQPTVAGGFIKKWYLHLYNDAVGGYGDITFDVPASGSITVVGVKHAFTQAANGGEDYLFETPDGLNWRMFHLTAELVHVATSAPTLPVAHQLWADTTGL